MSNKFKNIIVSVLFLTILLLVFVLNILKPDTEISIAERRKLEQFPSFTLQNLFNGTFFSKFDTYVNDQFISRDNFRTAKAKLDLTFKGNYHNIYIKNDYLVEQTYPLSYASVTNLTKKITDIKNKYLANNKIYFSIVPDKNYFVNDNNLKMDYDLLESKMKENLDFATYIKILDKLDLTDYYKTDSHWKQENIQKVADELLKGMNNYSSSSYNVENIAKFKGTYAYRVPVNTDFDEINIMTNDILKNARVFNYTTNTYTNVYDLNKKNSLDKYDIYLSGATPLLTIFNDKNTSGKELIIFRDSYGSSLAPLLLSSYSKITLVDTRYISPTILGNYINFDNKDVLFIYSISIINNSYSLK